MENKLLIHKLKNNAELAWAAYGYYDLMTNSDSRLFIEIQNKKNENSTKKEITLTDIMDLQIIRCISHNYHQTLNPIK